MTASSMTVVAPHEAAGKTLNIYLYGKNSQVTHLFSGDASYFLDRKLVVSRTETTIREENFSCPGCQGFIWIRKPGGVSCWAPARPLFT